ncbi:MAG: hypothetical protein JSS49_08380 [Planctomycetes bacterium]|nr:hypothetical protein [Planctomycetota bacterium]
MSASQSVPLPVVPSEMPPIARPVASPDTEPSSAELAAELNRLETTERIERDRKAVAEQERLRQLRDLARYD